MVFKGNKGLKPVAFASCDEYDVRAQKTPVPGQCATLGIRKAYKCTFVTQAMRQLHSTCAAAPPGCSRRARGRCTRGPAARHLAPPRPGTGPCPTPRTGPASRVQVVQVVSGVCVDDINNPRYVTVPVYIELLLFKQCGTGVGSNSV
jgi:hypothetical protein